MTVVDQDVVVDVDAVVVPVLSYALAHNRVPVVARLSLVNRSSTDLDVAVTIAVEDALGLLSEAWTRDLVLQAGQGFEDVDVDLRLIPAQMLQVEEQRPGRLRITVASAGAALTERTFPVQVLAAHQWLRGMSSTLPLELLASHVLPNDPAVARLVAEASTLLMESTGSPSIEGYQSGSGRVEHIVKALCSAVVARRIRYAEPPASWADRGQKVRTPSEVLDDRVGTCLDTVVVLAAALEQSGIRPLLWLVKGHAFLGYWREETACGEIVSTDVAWLANQVDLGRIGLVETTALTEREEPVPFDRVQQLPVVEHLTGDLSDVLGVTDVWVARQNHILPLPSRTRDAAGNVHVVAYQPREHSQPRSLAQRPADRPTSTLTDRAVPPRVQQWKNALLDLSLRNRLINFSERTSVPLVVAPDDLGRVEDLLHSKQPLSLLPGDALDGIHGLRGAPHAGMLAAAELSEVLDRRRAVFTTLTAATYPSRLRALAYKARTIVEETGANNLYLALGTLEWQQDGKALRSPLVLVPVHLTTRARTNAYRLELDESGSSTPNYCLLEKLRQVHDLEIPGLANPVQDDSGIDLQAAFDSVRVAIDEAGLPYRVANTADIAVLQFAKFRLWKDLDEHWPSFLQNALVRHLVESPLQEFADPVADVPRDLDELEAACPIPADASQLAAIAKACAGRTFVLEGPPGTGKSQTITNLLTRAVADGKKVLFVAEKRAALDVVQKRLESVGLGPFCLDLHDKGSKPAAVREQLRQALDHRVDVDTQGLAVTSDDLRTARGHLARYAGRLHERNGAGLSYYSARTQLLTVGEVTAVLPVPVALLAEGQRPVVESLRKLLLDLPDTADLTRPVPHHPWGFFEPELPALVDLPRLQAAARSFDEAVADLPREGSLGDAVEAAQTPGELMALAALARRPIPLTVLDETATPAWASATSSLTREIGAFVAAAHPGLDVATPLSLELPLADLHAQAQAAAASGFFGRKKRLRAVLEQLAPTLRPDADVAPKRVPELTAALLQVQGAVQALAARASDVPGLQIPSSWNPLTGDGKTLVARQVEWLSWTGKAVRRRADAPPVDFASAVRRYLDSPGASGTRHADAILRAGTAGEELAAVAMTSLDGWQAWSGDSGLVVRWRTTEIARGVHDAGALPLRRWVAFLEALEPLRGNGLSAPRRLLLTGACPADEAVRAWDAGIALASLQERATVTGLDAFDGERHDRIVANYNSSAASVRRYMTTAAPAEVLSRRPFAPGADKGQVGALGRELAKQRRGLGVRSLLSTYGDLITSLMPCVLVSPDSVARFFPVGDQLFDIVVFDEASQIRVADAVGVMGRAKSVVVVGDSKQMPPTSFAEPSVDRSDDEPEEDEQARIVEDEESILSECVQAKVDQDWLSWHYRSFDESLIAFSNQRYYDGKLSSFPGPVAPGRTRAGAGIRLVRVDGTFQRSGKGKLLRTNDVEARAVVAEISRRFAQSPDREPSIGVVTFNQQQRAHVESLIRDGGDDRLIESLDRREGEGLFIKNLENVQGDERDVILFSTAFSANEKGVVPLNFGPLNRGGGERRLNVAVTRARREVVVFSSFDPSMLRAEETTSVGIKHLRAYLDLAANGTSALSSAVTRARAADRHRDEIAEGMRNRGFTVHTDVGLSDFKVDLAVARPEDPDTPVLAVLLDGPGWAARRTVGDRDGLPNAVLRNLMEWPAVERVWAPTWVTDRDGVLSRLAERATSARSAPRPPVVAEPPAPVVAPQPVALPPPASVSALPGALPYVPWQSTIRGSRDVLDALPDPRAARQVRAVLEEAVAAEGPVHLDALAKSVAAAFDLSRVSASRASSIVAQLPRDLVPDPQERFAWPRETSPDEWQGFRRASDGAARPIEHVSLREIGNAMVALCASCGGMERTELLKEAYAVFGGRRMTTVITKRLAEALELAQDEARLEARAGLVVAA